MTANAAHERELRAKGTHGDPPVTRSRSQALASMLATADALKLSDGTASDNGTDAPLSTPSALPVSAPAFKKVLERCVHLREGTLTQLDTQYDFHTCFNCYTKTLIPLDDEAGLPRGEGDKYKLRTVMNYIVVIASAAYGLYTLFQSGGETAPSIALLPPRGDEN